MKKGKDPVLPAFLAEQGQMAQPAHQAWDSQYLLFRTFGLVPEDSETPDTCECVHSLAGNYRPSPREWCAHVDPQQMLFNKEERKLYSIFRSSIIAARPWGVQSSQSES